jgi:hypothetical protein
MFYCGNCNKLTQPNESANHVVVNTRKKTYENRAKEKVLISEGFEIVKEILVCKECIKNFEVTDGQETETISQV